MTYNVINAQIIQRYLTFIHFDIKYFVNDPALIE